MTLHTIQMKNPKIKLEVLYQWAICIERAECQQLNMHLKGEFPNRLNFSSLHDQRAGPYLGRGGGGGGGGRGQDRI